MNLSDIEAAGESSRIKPKAGWLVPVDPVEAAEDVANCEGVANSIEINELEPQQLELGGQVLFEGAQDLVVLLGFIRDQFRGEAMERVRKPTSQQSSISVDDLITLAMPSSPISGYI